MPKSDKTAKNGPFLRFTKPPKPEITEIWWNGQKRSFSTFYEAAKTWKYRNLIKRQKTVFFLRFTKPLTPENTEIW